MILCALRIQEGDDANAAAEDDASLGVQLTDAWGRIDQMLDSFIAMIPQIVIAIVVFLIVYLIARIVSKVIRETIRRTQKNEALAIVVARLARWGILLGGLIVAVSIIAPSLQADDLLQLLGIGGVAIGFAFRDILQNFLAGILLLLKQPFRVGDTIEVTDYVGVVEQIETRATLLRTFDGLRVVIPNANVYTNPVEVKTALPDRRSEFVVGVAYDTDLSEAKSTVLEAVRSIEGVLEDPVPSAQVTELAASSMNIRVRWWIDQSRSGLLDISDAVIQRVKERLDEAGIEIPFPIRTVHFHDQTPREQERAQ